MHAEQADQATKARGAPASLVAGTLLIALVAAVVLGGKLVHDRTATRTGTTAAQNTQLSYQAQLALLEQRPVQLPSYKSADLCQDNGSFNSVGFDFGAGPVYANGGPASLSSWGDFYDVVWFTGPKLTGPVLIRGRDLVTNNDVIFTGAGAAGPIVATDPSQASPALRSELVLDAGHPAQRQNGYGMFPVRQGVPTGWSHCVGFQMDGPTFTEKLTTPG